MKVNNKISGMFENKDTAIRAVEHLSKIGFNEDNMSLLVAKDTWESDLKKKKDDLNVVEHNKASEGTAIGAGVGGAIGAIAAGLTAVGVVVATGGVALIGSGTIIAALAGGGAGGVVGGLAAGLIGLGFSESEAQYIDNKLGDGHVMLSIEATKDEIRKLESEFKALDADNVTVH